MSIRARDRKILWSLAGNSCSRCEADLVRRPEAEGDRHVVLGEECHIVGRSLAGPRGKQEPAGGLDEYGNLILLCPVCHRLVDKQTERWSAAALCSLKAEHEAKVAGRKRAPGIGPIRLLGGTRPFPLPLVTNGDQLAAITGAAYTFRNSAPAAMTRHQREMVGDFLQNVRDWGDIWDEIGPKGHLDAGESLQGDLDALRLEGLVVYAASRRLKVESDDSPWPDAGFAVRHISEVLEGAGKGK